MNITAIFYLSINKLYIYYYILRIWVGLVIIPNKLFFISYLIIIKY